MHLRSHCRYATTDGGDVDDEPGSPQWAHAARTRLDDLDRTYRAAGPDRAAALLDESIDLARSYLVVRPDGRDRRAVESGLAVDLSERYQHHGRAADLDEAIAIGRRRITVDDPASWVTDRVNLAARLLRAYDDRDDATLLDEAVALLEPAVSEPGVEPEGRAMLALNLSAAHSHRYDRDGTVEDLRRAIALHDVVALHPDPDEVAGGRSQLASLLVDLFRTGEDPSALDRALVEAHAAADAGGSVVEQASRRHTLAQIALASHEAGRDGALDVAADAARTALELLPAGSPATGTYLATHSAVDFERYLAGHGRQLLDSAVRLATDGLELPDLDVHSVAALANQACLTRTERFEVDGDRTDLDAAIRLGRDVLDAVTRADIDLAVRTNLANALNQAYHLDGATALLTEGVAVITPAVERTPSGSRRAARLNTAGLLRANLGRALGSAPRISAAIGLGREAMELTDPGTQEFVIYSTNVANWHSDLFEMAGDREELDEAITVLGRAREGVTDGSPIEARLLFTLGVLYADRYEHVTHADGVDDLQTACDLWDESLVADEPFVTVRAGKRLGDVAFQNGLWAQCEQALGYALDAARRLTGRRRVPGDRERARADVQGTAAVAAVAAVRDGRPDAAVVHLEQAAATLLAEAAGHPAEQVTLDAVAAAAARLGGPIVYWATTGDGGVALVVAPDGVVDAHPLAMTSGDVDAVLDGLRTAFATRTGSPEATLAVWDAAARAAVERTRELALAPLGDLLVRAGTVGLLPIGRVAWLPLAAAVDTGPGGAVPRTLANARTLAAPAPWPAHPRAAVLGDPGEGRRFLPSVAREMQVVAECYRRPAPDPAAAGEAPSPHRLLRRGTEPQQPADPEPPAALLDGLAGVDVAHLACHFDLDPEDPARSVLRIGRGVTLGSLVSDAPDRLPHLVLSACDAGLSGSRLPDEAIGPVAMLVHAGARSVLAPLWPVDDELAPPFVRAYHGRLAAGTDPATALSLTRRAAVAGGHPVIWACWTHTGP